MNPIERIDRLIVAACRLEEFFLDVEDRDRASAAGALRSELIERRRAEQLAGAISRDLAQAFAREGLRP